MEAVFAASLNLSKANPGVWDAVLAGEDVLPLADFVGEVRGGPMLADHVFRVSDFKPSSSSIKVHYNFCWSIKFIKTFFGSIKSIRKYFCPLKYMLFH